MEIIASGHRWGEWEVIKESTAIEEGWQQRTCKICGMHDDEMIPKLSPAPTPNSRSNKSIYRDNNQGQNHHIETRFFLEECKIFYI